MAIYPFLKQETHTCAMRQNNKETAYRYKLSLVIDGTRQIVDINEVEMDGWRLFECFLHGAETLVYLSQDEGETEITCVDMDDEDDAGYAAILITALTQFRKMRR